MLIVNIAQKSRLVFDILDKHPNFFGVFSRSLQKMAEFWHSALIFVIFLIFFSVALDIHLCDGVK